MDEAQGLVASHKRNENQYEDAVADIHVESVNQLRADVILKTISYVRAIFKLKTIQ